MEIVDREREELLERVRWKKKQWETRSLCRAVLVGMMDKAVESSEEKYCTDMVSGLVEDAWIEICTRRIVEEIWESEDSIRREVEKRLDERREEEESMLMMLAMEEDKRKRLERVEMLRKILMKKMTAQKLRTVLQMLQGLTLEELEMEVEEVEALVMELMDTEEMQELDDVEISEVTITALEGEGGITDYMEEQSSTRDSLESKEEEDNQEVEMNSMEVEEATDILDKWVGVGGAELITGGLNYTPGWEFSLPKYTFASYKPHCSRRRLEKFGPESVDGGSEAEAAVESISDNSEIEESQLVEIKATADISKIADNGELGILAVRAVCDVKGRGTRLRSAVQGSLQKNNDEHLTFSQNRGGDTASLHLHLISTSSNAREANKTKNKNICNYTTISSVELGETSTSKRPRDLDDDGESLVKRTRHKKKWRGD